MYDNVHTPVLQDIGIQDGTIFSGLREKTWVEKKTIQLNTLTSNFYVRHSSTRIKFPHFNRFSSV